MTISKLVTLLVLLLHSQIGWTQTTLIPDTVFEQALINQGYDSLLDGGVLTSNIDSITYLSMNGVSIVDLTGIEDFSELRQLQVLGTQLTSLDVSSNTKLRVLDCGWSKLTSLNLGSSGISELWCDSNYLSNLDVSQCYQLDTLICGINQLTTLDVSNNTSLTNFYCRDNPLICLKVGAVQPFTFDATETPSLSCIEVADTNYANSNWTVAGGSIDATASFSTDCGNPCLLSQPDQIMRNSDRTLLYIVDLLGRSININTFGILVYVYSDGSTEKKVILGEW